MDRLDAMRVFARVAERRSFSLAAEDLGLPRSTVTDAVKQLERRLGVRLLERTTRVVRPTHDGEAYLARCLSILADVENAEAAFASAKPRGLIRVDVHGRMARHFLAPKLPSFLETYPEIHLHMSEGDRLADLIREGVDCALRAGAPEQSDLIARRVALLKEVTVVAPQYLEGRPYPTHPDMLPGAYDMVGFHSSKTNQLMPLDFKIDGQMRELKLNARLTVNAAESYHVAAKLGLGVIQAPQYSVQSALNSGELVQILKEFPPSPTPVSLLYPQKRSLSARVRVFIDWLMAIDEFKNQQDAAS